MSAPLELSFTVPDKVAINGVRHVMFKESGTWKRMAMTIILYLAFIYFLTRDFAVIATAVVAFLVIIPLMFWYLPRRAHKRARHMVGEQRWTFGKRVAWTVDGTESSVAWEHFSKVRELEESYALMSGRTLHLIPKESLTTPQRDQLLALFRANGLIKN